MTPYLLTSKTSKTMAKALTFEKDGSIWVAEATVSADYHLHVERAEGVSPFNIKQRAGDAGQWADCRPMPYNVWGQVVDWTFRHGVYPAEGLHVRFESGTEVTSATLWEEGEG